MTVTIKDVNTADNKKISPNEILIGANKIKALKNTILNNLITDYNMYTIIPEKYFIINIVNNDQEYNDTFFYNNLSEPPHYNSINSDTIYHLYLYFYVKDEIPYNQEYYAFQSNIKEKYGAEFVYNNSIYYKQKLTYGIMSDRIKKYHRISDIKKAQKTNQEAIYSMYSKGIMIGYSNGNYSISRKFLPNDKTKRSEMQEWISRLNGSNKKRIFTPNGMLIRNINLPFNSKEWMYILEDIPNEFYTMRYI